MIKLFIFCFAAIATITTNASITKFACPTASTLMYSLAPQQKSSEVTGIIQDLNDTGNSFILVGKTNNANAVKLISASWWKNYLSCHYASNKPNANIDLVSQAEQTPLLAYCYFINEAPGVKRCKGDAEYCAIKCEVLD